jgi:MFS family permease
VGSRTTATVENYDFIGYGTAAALYFGTAFFPSADPVTGTLLSFGTLGIGLATRPLGGIVGGYLGDKIGLGPGDDTDYPHVGLAAGRLVASGEADRALLVCGTGIGVAMAAGTVPGVRASVAHDACSRSGWSGPTTPRSSRWGSG